MSRNIIKSAIRITGVNRKCYLESKSDDNTKQPSVTLH